MLEKLPAEEKVYSTITQVLIKAMIDAKCQFTMWPLERCTAVESIWKIASTVFNVEHKEYKSY